MKKPLNNLKGFTLTELLIMISIFLIVTMAIYSAHLISQRAYRESEMLAELSQNGRIVLERMTREIRQAREIVTELPATSTEATSTIEFQDGHDLSYIHYIRYFRDENDNTVKREELAYYFSFSGNPNDPTTYVMWNAIPPENEQLVTIILKSPEIIGEYVINLGFWGTRVINIFITLGKEAKSIELSTKIFGRNL